MHPAISEHGRRSIDVPANATPYGLASVVWTKDLQRTLRVARAIQSGIVWVNCWMVRDLRTPFGGVKHSGWAVKEAWKP